MSAGVERTFEIRGMSCAACAKRVERAAMRVDGVTKADVDLVRERLAVSLDHEIPEGRLEAAVRDAGYELVVPRPRGAAPSAIDRSAIVAVAAAVLAALTLVVDVSVPGRVGALLSLTLASIVVLGLGAKILVRAARSLREPGMDLLVSIAALAALLGSVVSLTLGHDGGAHGHSDASTAALVVAIVLVGKTIEHRAKARAARAIAASSEVLEGTVEVVRHGEKGRIALAELRPGDVATVPAFAPIPADGVITSGRADLDEAFLTGESRIVRRETGEAVHLGAHNGGAAFTMEVRAIGKDTLRARIEGTMDAASRERPRLAELADRVSRVFTPVVLVIALASFLGWWVASGSLAHATSIALAVLVVACPCALGLATPAAVAVALGRAAREGLVVKDARRFEELARVRVMAFDKTGTLTAGKPTLTKALVLGAIDPREALRLAASLEAKVEHPLARAIFLGAMAGDIAVAPASDVVVVPGEGVRGDVGRRRVSVGRVDDESVSDPETRAAIRAARARGASAALLTVDDVPAAVFLVEDAIRPGAREALAQLAGAGVRVVLLSGDHASAVESVAAQLGVTDARGGLSPSAKLEAIAALRREHGALAMIGDGINDAPSLAAADVGIAMAGGAEAALGAGAVAITSGELSSLVRGRSLARALGRTIRAALAWAFAYNLLALPLAAMGALDRIGGAPVAAAAMAGSSIVVVLVALRLGRQSLPP
jgi:Cu+-exporting ATPase